MPYENILSPLKIGKQIVKNRIAMSPVGTSLQDTQGMATSEMVDFYEARAKGGTVMVISPELSVTINVPFSPLNSTVPLPAI